MQHDTKQIYFAKLNSGKNAESHSALTKLFLLDIILLAGLWK
jgi:hypothetical protein